MLRGCKASTALPVHVVYLHAAEGLGLRSPLEPNADQSHPASVTHPVISHPSATVASVPSTSAESGPGGPVASSGVAAEARTQDPKNPKNPREEEVGESVGAAVVAAAAAVGDVTESVKSSVQKGLRALNARIRAHFNLKAQVYF